MASTNTQTKTLDVSGVLALSGSPTGSGIYTIHTFSAAASQVLTTITGGSGSAVVTLHPATAGQYFRIDASATFKLLQGASFIPQTIDDRIVLRLHESGTYWIEEVPRVNF
jgi:hypothetical protein